MLLHQVISYRYEYYYDVLDRQQPISLFLLAASEVSTNVLVETHGKDEEHAYKKLLDTEPCHISMQSLASSQRQAREYLAT